MIKRTRGSKFGAKKTIVDEIKFDSTIESKYYLHLKERAILGEILHLELQPSYVIMEGFRRNGVKIRDIVYKPDFSYFDVKRGKFIICDVKGSPDSTYKLKAKLFLAYLEKNDKETLFQEIYWKSKKWDVIER
jgi:hypothetical protein